MRYSIVALLISATLATAGRYYDPEVGCFTSVDPAGEFHNAYSYTGGNPILMIDPSGLSSTLFYDEQGSMVDYHYDPFGPDETYHVQQYWSDGQFITQPYEGANTWSYDAYAMSPNTFDALFHSPTSVFGGTYAGDYLSATGNSSVTGSDLALNWQAQNYVTDQFNSSFTREVLYAQGLSLLKTAEIGYTTYAADMVFGIGLQAAAEGIAAYQAGRGLSAARTSSTVTANRAAGNAYRDAVANQFSNAGYGIRTEVTKATPFGRRVIDVEVYTNPTFSQCLGGIECKVGASRYLASQRAKDFWLQMRHGYPVQMMRKP